MKEEKMLIFGISAMLFIAFSVLVLPGSSVKTGDYIYSEDKKSQKIPACNENDINEMAGKERNPLYFNYYIYDSHVVVSGNAITGRFAMEPYGEPLYFDEGSISLNTIQNSRAYFTFSTPGYECWFMKEKQN